MLVLISVIIVGFVLHPAVSNCYGNFDYCWREFKTVIPQDALLANQGRSDGAVYIAQGFFVNAGILPAGLYPNTPEIVATAQQKIFATTKHIKVLCTSHPNLFRWVQTSTAKLEDLKTKCELVYGGVETDRTQFIGRGVQNGKLMVGKVYMFDDGTSVFGLPANNPTNEIRYTEFEVLTYNCHETCQASISCRV